MKKPVKKKERAPLKEDLKIRVLNAKKMLPRSGVTSLFFHYFKDTFNERRRIYKIKNRRKSNEDFILSSYALGNLGRQKSY